MLGGSLEAMTNLHTFRLLVGVLHVCLMILMVTVDAWPG